MVDSGIKFVVFIVYVDVTSGMEIDKSQDPSPLRRHATKTPQQHDKPRLSKTTDRRNSISSAIYAEFDENNLLDLQAVT